MFPSKLHAACSSVIQTLSDKIASKTLPESICFLCSRNLNLSMRKTLLFKDTICATGHLCPSLCISLLPHKKGSWRRSMKGFEELGLDKSSWMAAAKPQALQDAAAPSDVWLGVLWGIFIVFFFFFSSPCGCLQETAASLPSELLFCSFLKPPALPTITKHHFVCGCWTDMSYGRYCS